MVDNKCFHDRCHVSENQGVLATDTNIIKECAEGIKGELLTCSPTR